VIAFCIRSGSGGVKAGFSRLRQPSGTVTMTASTSKDFDASCRRTPGWPSCLGLDSTKSIMVEKCVFALERAVFAMRSRIALYVLATNRFSVQYQYPDCSCFRGHFYLHLYIPRARSTINH
jgi:hypothetical protein